MTRGLKKTWFDLEFFQSKHWQSITACIRENCDNHFWAPHYTDIFRPFILSPRSRTKVVMVGPGFRSHVERSDGLLYSSQCPPWAEESRIIFRELQTDLNYRGVPSSCDLSSWARQGILMLNTSLSKTVGEGLDENTRFQDEFWEDLVLEVMYESALMDSDMVFLIIGDKAIDMADGLSLPSWSRCIYVNDPINKKNDEGSFAGSRVFSRVNYQLKAANKATINWSLPGCNKY